MSQNIETLMKQERDIIVNAYNREPIDGIQNWFIRDGERYYELHMEGKSRIREYSSGETSREIKTVDNVGGTKRDNVGGTSTGEQVG
jgi:hypothetical protein